MNNVGLLCSLQWAVPVALTVTLHAIGQPLEFSAPQSVPAGSEIPLSIRFQGKPVEGAEIRLRGPATAAAQAGSTGSQVRRGPGLSFSPLVRLFPGELVLLLPETSGPWCRIITPVSGIGFAPCASLLPQPIPQPLGATNEAGKLRIKKISFAVTELELEANWQGRKASRRILITAAVMDRSEQVASGIRFRERAFFKDGDGPFRMQILEIDPSQPAIRIMPVRGKDRAAGRETVRSLAHRYGATAAVNGGYFVLTGPFAGAATGVYQTGGQLISSGSGRSAVALCAEKGTITGARIGVFDFYGIVSHRNNTFPIMGLNRPRLEQDLVLYTPDLGPSTYSAGGGIELALDSDRRVAEVFDGAGNTVIPPEGSVLSGSGLAADWLRAAVKKGEKLEIDVGLRANPEVPLSCDPTDIFAAGPQIVRGGRAFIRSENIGHEAVRHPRTALAVTKSGRFLFVTLDGRQPASAGMRLDEFAEELVRLGAEEALNLDGGGSTTMVVNGQVRNSPSDRAERPVGDAILLFSIPSKDALLRLFDRLAEDPAHIPAGMRGPLRKAILTGSASAFRKEMERGPRISLQARRLLSRAEAILR